MKRGRTLDDRLKREIQNTMSVNAAFVQKSYEDIAYDKIYEFLQKVDTIDSIRNTVQDFVAKISSIQTKFRRRQITLQSRESAISDVVWEREIGYLTRIFQKKKKGEKVSKKQQKIIQKMVVIPKDIKERILFLYMTRQKFYFTIRFLQWLINYRGEGYEVEQLEEMQESIDQRGNWMYEIDYMLFGNQDWVPVMIPDHISNLQKLQKKSSPKKKKDKDKGNESDEEVKVNEMDDSALMKVQSPSLKKGKSKNENSSSNVLKEHMDKAKLD